MERKDRTLADAVVEFMEAAKRAWATIGEIMKNVVEIIRERDKKANKFIRYPLVEVEPMESQVLDNKPLMARVRNNC